MTNRVVSFVCAVIALLPVSTHAAEDLISQLEQCTAPEGFTGSFYSIAPGDMGLGFNLKFRVVNGQGYYTRDYLLKTEKSKLVWSEWRQVPRISFTAEGRLRIELQSPTVLLRMDVSIGARTITGMAEYPYEMDERWYEKRPDKFKIVCAAG